MKVLLTGGTGFLGSYIARELCCRHYQVRVLVRPSSDLRRLAGLNIETFTGDLLHPEDLRRALAGCDAVIHAAALIDQASTDLEHFEQVNVQATILLVEAALEEGVHRFIYVGSANATGYGSIEHPGTEWSEFNLFRYGSGYINSKYLAQQYVLEQVEKRGLPAVVVNPAFLLGPFDQKSGPGVVIRRGLSHRIQWCPPGGKNFIHVRDAAIAICQALTHGEAGECYLLAGENMRFRTFFRLLNRLGGHRAIQVRVPACLLIIAGFIGSVLGKLSGRPRLLNLVNARILCLGLFYSGARAREVLGLPGTPVATAIRETLRWFSEGGDRPSGTGIPHSDRGQLPADGSPEGIIEQARSADHGGVLSER